MDDLKREITHNNVERLVEAMKSDRARVSELIETVRGLEAKVAMLTSELNQTKGRASAAFALATGRGSTEG